MHITQTLRRPANAIVFTWVVVLLASDLTNAAWQALIGDPPAWLFWAKVGLLLALIFASQAWKSIQPIRSYLILLLVLMVASFGMSWLRSTPAYLQWDHRAGFLWGMVAFQLLKLVVSGIMILALLLMGRHRQEFFLTPGQLAAPVRATPPGANARRSITWGRLGLILGLCLLPLTLLFFGLVNLPTSQTLARALPLFPAALLFAITNAFSEEMQFRASLLSDLHTVLGEDHAIWITAVFFGFAHYFGGTPAGLPGVLIAGLLGALFAKCMLGSKGIAVPWFIHFCQNAVIYAFWAIGSVA